MGMSAHEKWRRTGESGATGKAAAGLLPTEVCPNPPLLPLTDSARGQQRPGRMRSLGEPRTVQGAAWVQGDSLGGSCQE